MSVPLRRTGASRTVPVALLASALVVSAGSCRHVPDAPVQMDSWPAALASVRAGLAERHASWGPLPAEGAARRMHLGQLAEYARAALRPIRERPQACDAALLANLIPRGTDAITEDDRRAGRYTFLGQSYARASVAVALPDGRAWLEIVDVAGAPDLVVPFEVKRAVAANDAAHQYRATTLAGFPAVETENPEPRASGLAARLVEVELGDRVLVVARGESAVPTVRLRAWIESLDLAEIERVVARATPREGFPASPSDRAEVRAEDG